MDKVQGAPWAFETCYQPDPVKESYRNEKHEYV